MNFISNNYNLGTYVVTVNVGAGTFPSYTLVQYARTTGSIIINGAGPSTKIVSNDAHTVYGMVSAGTYHVRNMHMELNSSLNLAAYALLLAQSGADIICRNVAFVCNENITNRTYSLRMCSVASGGRLIIGSGCSFVANGNPTNPHVYVFFAGGGEITIGESLMTQGEAISINGVVAVTAYAEEGGVIRRENTAKPILTGTVAGKRYDARLNSVILTQGGGVNYFPGSVVGTVATGAQYA